MQVFLHTACLLGMALSTGGVSRAVQAQRPSAAAKTSPYLDATSLNFDALALPPPAAGSPADRRDMQAVLEAQRRRTPAEVSQAQRDDREEDIFVFASVLGPDFNAAKLPSTAALSQHLRQTSAVINPGLKLHFHRARPFVVSADVQPVCERTSSNSYPSGHSMVGTLEALALTQMFPEYSVYILKRLNEYTQNRIVCGVHYPTDVEASRTIGATLFGLIAASPVFQADLKAARQEARSALGVSPLLSTAEQPNLLASNTVLIVRHAEKPAESSGMSGLTEAGQQRARAYATYFQPFRVEAVDLRVTALFAGADSASSVRPRLTLEPLSQASGLPLNSTFSTKQPSTLVQFLRTHPHGNVPLICWRHGQIPELLKALGASPAFLLPDAKWPDDVYDWVVVLHFDNAGRLQSQQLLHESLHLH